MAPASSRLRAGCAASLLFVASSRWASPVVTHSAFSELEGTPDVQKLFVSADTTICGGTALRQFLSAPTNADEVRNIPWSQIDAVANEFIRSRNADVVRLSNELKRLQALIPEREKAESPKAMPEADIQKSVLAAVQVAGSYGSLEAATRSKCGAVMFRPRINSAAAFKAASESFRFSINDALKSGAISVRSSAFAAVCNLYLDTKAGDLVSNCDELCQAFADSAQSASDTFAGALAVNGKSADQLRRDVEATAALIRQAESDRESCSKTKQEIEVFKMQLLAIGVDVKEKHGKLMDARDALMDAQYNLMDAEDSVAKQQAETERTGRVLQAAGAVVRAVTERVRQAEAAAASARTALNGTQQEFSAVQASLKSAQDTSDVVQQLKAAVTDSMMKMMLYFDEAVRKPVRVLGMGDESRVNSFFPVSLTALEGAKATRSSMEALNTFCSREETQRALAAGAADGVDPRELCSIGDVPSIEKDIDNTVAKSVDTLKAHLTEVRSWLDPYKGQNAMTREQVLANIAQGELVGLREVITSFGNTTYYRGYLRNWQLKGRFQDIMKALSDALKRSEQAHSAANLKLTMARGMLAASETTLQAAATALDGAIKANNFAGSLHNEAMAALAGLQAAADVVKKNVQDLEAAVAAAEARYQAARSSLELVHKEAVSLVELLQELEALA